MIATALCLLAISATALEAPDRVTADISFKEWLSQGECFNLAIAPQFNSQHSILGLLKHLKDDGLLDKLTAVSSSSAGSLPAAIIAAGKDPNEFLSAFPEDGWNGFGPSEPNITHDYKHFLNKILPHKFEELDKPLALTATSWASEEALQRFFKDKSKDIVLNEGRLHKAMLASISTGHSGLINDPSCPKCKNGFWPRDVSEEHPIVTDGSFVDIWGTNGLKQLPKCNRLVHVLPVDYQGQTDPQPAADIEGKPDEVVTLIVSQPPIASHSHYQQLIKNSGAPAFTQKTAHQWNQKVFSHSKENMGKAMHHPMLVEKIVPDASKHYVVAIDNVKTLREEESFTEKVFDAFMETMKDNFWKHTA